MSKKILILSNNLQPGGAERQLVYISKILSRQHEVHFAVFEKKGIFINDLEQLGIPIHTFQRRNLWQSSRNLRLFVKKEKFDVVVSYLPECNMINVLAGLPFRSWHIVTGARNANPKYVVDHKLQWYYHIHLLSDSVISNSASNKSDILKVNKWINSDKVHVIYNILEPIKCNSQYIPYKNGKINIAVAANYRFQKNLVGVLHALSSMNPQQIDQLHIDWYGLEIDSSLANGRQFISDHNLENVITLHPSSNQIMDIYNEADAVGLFSHYEGLPNSLCEALQLGKLVICTPVSDMPMLLKDTGNIVCNSDMAEDIKEGIIKLTKIQRNTIINIGEMNKEKFSALFNKDSIEKQLLRLFQ